MKYQSCWRALIHLAFLAFLCSFFIMLAGHDYMLKKIEKPLDKFEETVGGIVLEHGAIFPEKDRNKAFEIMIDPNIKLIYAPNLGVVNPNWINQNGMTFLWVPRMWGLIHKSTNDSMIQVVTGFPGSSMQDHSEVKNLDELMAHLHKRGESADKNVQNAEKRTTIFSRIEVEQMYLGGLFFYFWFEFCFQTLLLTIMFSVFYRWVGARNMTKLTFKEIFVCGLYAAVPPMLISMFFPALNLPFFNFTTIFLIAFSIYFICVLNFLERMAVQEDSTSYTGE